MKLDPGVILLKLFAVALLVALNGFFVAAEFALVKLRDTQLVPLIALGHRRALRARHVLQNLDRYLSAAQLGITLASLALGWVGEPIFSTLLAPVMDWLRIDSPEARHTIAVIVGFTIITFLHITAGEQAPKWMAIQNPLPASLWVAHPLTWFCAITYPFIWVLNRSSLWMLRRAGIDPAGEGKGAHSDEELRLLLVASQKEVAKAPGRDLVLNALDLKHRVARDVMRPRQEIAALSTTASMTECLNLAEKTRFSRFPLCEGGEIDKTLGVVHFKDLYAMRIKARCGADLQPVARKIVYVPETARLESLLHRFLDRKLHLALVVDEYGGTVGLLTFENVIEELVGQIQDEFDQEKPLVAKVGELTWEVQGALPVRDLSELAGEPLAEEGVTTTSGWVTQRLGGFPKAGDVIALANCELRVEEMDEMRVARLRLRKIAKEGLAES